MKNLRGRKSPRPHSRVLHSKMFIALDKPDLVGPLQKTRIKLDKAYKVRQRQDRNKTHIKLLWLSYRALLILPFLCFLSTIKKKVVGYNLQQINKNTHTHTQHTQYTHNTHTLNKNVFPHSPL